MPYLQTAVVNVFRMPLCSVTSLLGALASRGNSFGRGPSAHSAVGARATRGPFSCRCPAVQWPDAPRFRDRRSALTRIKLKNVSNRQLVHEV